ncbi:MAG: phosphoribosylpyrophosphate synthetase [Flavobacterium sp.]|nr:phosphoribosylpyrophosphate synthetase [Flavobacterium sp.]
MTNYDTLVEALNNLKQKGFTTDFNIAFDKVQCKATGACLNPSEFEIVAHYRFEGKNDPDDSSVVYVIAAKDGSIKGILVNAYGMYGDAVSDDLIKKLAINE